MLLVRNLKEHVGRADPAWSRLPGLRVALILVGELQRRAGREPRVQLSSAQLSSARRAARKRRSGSRLTPSRACR